jgi:uncharacterized OB-fold protein
MMTGQQGQNEELLSMNYIVSLSVRYDAGLYMGRFFKGLIDKKILANKCPKCGRKAAPPRAICGMCRDIEMTEWVEAKDEGILESLEICYYDFIQSNTGEMQKSPWAKGLILLDGGVYLEHMVWPPDPAQHKLGDRYKAVWNEKRIGEFHDIVHFVKKEQE